MMKMNFNLNLVQAQKLIMTPELKQAIEILQYNALELNEFINEELLNNPILEKENHVDLHQLSKTQSEVDLSDPKDQKEKDTEVDWQALMKHIDGPKNDYSQVYNPSEGEEDLNYEQFVAKEETLKEHLMSQLNVLGLSKEELKVCEYIVENIDDNGYLSLQTEEAMQVFDWAEEDIEAMIDCVQSLDPPGVAGRTVAECLSIQLYHLGGEKSLEYQLVNDHLEDLAGKKWDKISKKTGAPVKDIQKACENIQGLEPKPGRMFSSLRSVRYVVPDVYVYREGNAYVVKLNEQATPQLKISSFYKKMLDQLSSDKATAEYISKHMQSALRLIRSIEQRKKTILRVCEAVVDHQFLFFDEGPLSLKPLKLKDVASEIDVHESTVSRAISGKYIQCPNGVFEIKYFFQSGLKAKDGEGVSSESTKWVIKHMIQAESPRKPLSDQKIAESLAQQGIEISRRTVAKYRDELGILSSSQRKSK